MIDFQPYFPQNQIIISYYKSSYFHSQTAPNPCKLPAASGLSSGLSVTARGAPPDAVWRGLLHPFVSREGLRGAGAASDVGQGCRRDRRRGPGSSRRRARWTSIFSAAAAQDLNRGSPGSG